MENYTFCFTGHRPGKLYGYDKKAEGNQKIISIWRERIVEMLDEARGNGYEGDFIFRSGMALGFDTWMAELIIELRDIEKYPVKLYCDIPCKNHSLKWSDKDKMKWYRITKQADKVTYVSNKEYTKDCMNNRNIYMVDRSEIILGLWDGTPSGTYNCIKYAREQDRYIINLNPETFEFEIIVELEYKK